MKRLIGLFVIAVLLAATLLFGCASDTLNSVSVEAAARSDEQAEETWLYIDCYGLCTVTNAEGKTLVCDVGISSGDLAFSDRRYTIDGGVNGCAVALFRVEESGSFTFSTEADSAGFAVIWNGFRQDISGTGIQQVVFTPSSVQAAGAEMDYTLDVSAAADTPELVRSIRSRFPDVPIIATGGPTAQSITRTVEAGANAISYTPPTTKELFTSMMEDYRSR